MKTPGASDKPGGRTRKWNQEFGPFLTLGLQLSLTVVAFFFLGRWADQKLGTEPWLMLVGIGIGVVGSLIKFVRTAMQLGNESEKRDREQADEDS